jgi:hypothetical protein
LALVILLLIHLVFSFGFMVKQRQTVAYVASDNSPLLQNKQTSLGPYPLSDDLNLSHESIQTDILRNSAILSGAITKDWTVMAYMAADNDLSQAALDDLNEMETAGSDERINVVTLIDLHDNPAIYYIGRDTPANPNIISQPITESLFGTEIDTGDPANLTVFAKWAIKTYPAKHYALLLWGHGLGWKGFGHDYSSSSDSLSPSEIEEALLSTKNSTGFTIDVLAFDACMMQMSEIVTALGNKHLTRLMVGSEETVPGAGLDYYKILSLLKENPSQSPETWASIIVDNYLSNYPEEKVTMSALLLEKTNDLTANLDSLADALLQSGEWENIYKARSQTECFSDPAYIDLYDFVVKLQVSVKNDNLLQEAQRMKDYLDQIILISGHNKTHPQIHGLSIYFPSNGNLDPGYYSLNFEVTSWNLFLIQYLSRNYTTNPH